MGRKAKRVVITGLGVISPNGIGKDSFWQSLEGGISGIGKITYFDTSGFPVKIGGEVKNFFPSKYIFNKDIRRMDKNAQFAVAASKMAFKDAKLKIGEISQEKIGVFMGTSIGGQSWIYPQHEKYMLKEYNKISPYTSIAVYPNACSAEVSIALGAKGPSETVSCACASSVITIGHVMWMLQKGLLNVAVLGGVDTPLSSPIFAALCAGRNLSKRNDFPQKASRPFDKERDGIVVSEGAGVLILEEYTHAIRRGAYIYAEIIGWGETCDAYHPIKPEESAIQESRAIRLALEDAQISPDKIDYICAHGLSLPLADKIETKAIKKAFKDRAYKIPVSSIKSMIGQPFAAAGALQIVASSLAIKNQTIPPTINYENVDPECDLDYVPGKCRSASLNYVLAETFAFGGKNASVILKKI